jgi:cellulose synthase/poly-beta-1,6-N-acetylglucosamine synthase-like glycosyltransferase
VYNERHVVERLIEAAVALDYPTGRLSIQVLDDSTDDTSAIVQRWLETHHGREIEIQHIRRGSREGYKAGALTEGLAANDAELVAIFDADFVPRPDFLRRMVPHFSDQQVGMVQARWSHLNSHYTPLTRAQALALDSHFLIEQTARHRGGLFMNFSGTAGVWRRTCIEDAGGWQGDTLSEDIDLSYRAQLRGWRFLYLPDVDAPAEIPPQIAAFKRQQSRWATGTIQCLLKLGKRILSGRLSLWQKFQAMLHLGGYFVHPLMLVLLLTSVPLMLAGQLNNLPLAPLGVAVLGTPLMSLITQATLHRDWPRRLAYFPFFLLMGAGIALSNTLAVGRALAGKPEGFRRTPKFHLQSGRDRWTSSALAGVLALRFGPELVPLYALYALGFGYVGALGVGQASRVRSARRSAPALGSLARMDVPQ